jgi:ATP-dependent DNA ligase
VPSQDSKTRFIEPMLLLPAETLPEGPGWIYQLKLDGHRAFAIKAGGEVWLSRGGNCPSARRCSDWYMLTLPDHKL